MPIGGSGVTGEKSRSAFGDLHVQLDLVSNVDLYQQRLATLEDAEKRANEAKAEAGRLLKNAKAKAEETAKVIIEGAEAQAQDRLDAVQDLETNLAADKKTWETEKAEEQTKLRSDRGKAVSAKTRRDKAKEEFEAEKTKAQAASGKHQAATQALQQAISDTKALWQKVGV